MLLFAVIVTPALGVGLGRRLSQPFHRFNLVLPVMKVASANNIPKKKPLNNGFFVQLISYFFGLLTTTSFFCTNSLKPSIDSSCPYPEFLIPPNGNSGVLSVIQLIQIMPVFSREASC